MRRFLWIGLMLTLFAGVAEAAVVDPRLVAANNDFGVRLLKKVTAAERGKNVFISPASMSLALSMTYNGADGSTKDAMAKTLGYQGLSLGQINSANAALLAGFAKPGAGVKLEIANSLWAKEGMPFYPDFVARNKQYYSAQITTLPFDYKAPGIINGWVAQQTHGKIKNIVDRIDSSNLLFLLNAVYFDGKWARVFKPSETSDLPFILSSGEKKTVRMMGQEIEDMRYLKTADAQLACLPYKGGRFSLWIVLPDKATGLSTLVEGLDVSSLEKWMAESKKEKVYVQLPRFKMEYSAKLNDVLSGLGMGIAFDSGNANFGNMCPLSSGGDIFVGEVAHKTFLEVDEQGTKAAAVTSVAMMARCAPVPTPRPIFFTVDHPFLCVIRANMSKSVLFIGAVEEP